MSVSPPPAPKPSPASPSWLTVIMTLIIGFLTNYYVQKPPPGPVVNPPVVVQPPVVTPPVVNPTAGPLTIVDSDNDPVVGAIDVGRLIVATAGPGYELVCTITPKNGGDSNVSKDSTSATVTLLKTGASVQFVAYSTNSGGSPVIVTIHATGSPSPVPVNNPPPNNQPPPPPPVVDTPPPTATKLTLVTVYDKINSQTAETLQNLSVINQLRAKGHIWKPLNSTLAVADPVSQAALTAAKSSTLPCFVILNQTNNAVIKVMPLPTAKDLLTAVQAAGG